MTLGKSHPSPAFSFLISAMHLPHLNHKATTQAQTVKPQETWVWMSVECGEAAPFSNVQGNQSLLPGEHTPLQIQRAVP